jgi:hypothetical protein
LTVPFLMVSKNLVGTDRCSCSKKEKSGDGDLHDDGKA